MKSKKETRITQVRLLINSIPEGRKSNFKRLVQYELAETYNIVMSESQLHTFIQSGYSSVAEEIIQAITTVVEKMIQEEMDYKTKIQEIQFQAA